MFAVILAGGTGCRLWPISRQEHPKQLHRLVSGLSLIQNTLLRILPIIPSPNIFIVTSERLRQEVNRQVCEICNVSELNILAEPEEKNTLPALGLAMLHIMKTDPSDIVCTLPIDHHIESEKQFRELLLYAESIVRTRRNIVSFGVKPDHPSTGCGYLQIGETLFEKNGIEVYKVLCVTEKPDQNAAQRFIKAGDYLWNRSVYLFQPAEMMEFIYRFVPRISQGLREIDSAISTSRFKEILSQAYSRMPGVSIASGVLEKVDNLLAIKVNFGWGDIGTWTGMENLWEKDEEMNAHKGKHIGIETKDCVIYSDGRLVATIGMKNIIAIATNDIVLICPKERAEDVKKMVEKVKQSGLQEYL